jgi:hypothetical protein
MGVVFLVVVPTEAYEKILKAGLSFCDFNSLKSAYIHLFIEISNAEIVSAAKNYNIPALQKNDLNIPSNTFLKTEVELRNKNEPPKKRGKIKPNVMDTKIVNAKNVDVPMEKARIIKNFMISFTIKMKQVDFRRSTEEARDRACFVEQR